MNSDVLRRSMRTFFQAFLGALLVTVPHTLVMDAAVYVEIGVSAAYAAVIATVTLVHVELETHGKVPDTRTAKDDENPERIGGGGAS